MIVEVTEKIAYQLILDEIDFIAQRWMLLKLTTGARKWDNLKQSIHLAPVKQIFGEDERIDEHVAQLLIEILREFTGI
jgi:hypothetical protein